MNELNSLHDTQMGYTHSSRTRNRVGPAHSIVDELYIFRLCKSASIFTAELLAIYHCLQATLRQAPPLPLSDLVIADALSVLKAIANPYSSHPLVSQIFALLSTLQSGSHTISFL